MDKMAQLIPLLEASGNGSAAACVPSRRGKLTVAAALKELPWRNVDPTQPSLKALTFLAFIPTMSSLLHLCWDSNQCCYLYLAFGIIPEFDVIITFRVGDINQSLVL